MDTEGKKSIKERIGATVVTVATTTTRVAKPKTSMAGSRKGGLTVSMYSHTFDVCLEVFGGSVKTITFI